MLVKYVGRKQIVSHDYARKRYTFMKSNNFICDIPMDLYYEIVRTFSRDYVPANEHHKIIKSIPGSERKVEDTSDRKFRCISCTESFRTSEEVRKHNLETHQRKPK